MRQLKLIKSSHELVGLLRRQTELLLPSERLLVSIMFPLSLPHQLHLVLA